MHRSASPTVVGAVVGAAAGLALGALLAVITSAALLVLSLGSDTPAGWTTGLIRPAILWIVAGCLGGALVGRRIARRVLASSDDAPPRPV